MSDLVNPLQLGLQIHKPEKPLSPHFGPCVEKIAVNPLLELQAHFWDSAGSARRAEGKEEKHGNRDGRSSGVWI